jgi:membrane-anchored protein YejM (alkaline phosphatase superfamily)
MSDSDSQFAARGLLFRWAGWFALANALLFGVVSLRYFGGQAPVDTPLAWLYLVTVYVGHHVLLTTVPLFLLATPLILLLPRRRILTVLAVTLFALMLALTMLDSLLWSQSRFHLNALTMKILGWQSWVFAGVIFLIGLWFESMLAKGVWNFVLAPTRRRGPLVGTLCLLAIVVSQSIHAWADAAYYVPVTRLGQMLPVYKGVTAKSFMTKMGLVDVAASRERELARRMAQDLDDSSDRLLNYPLQPLQCSGGEDLNLLFIVADSLRGDVVTPQLAPNITGFAARYGADFRNHFSGGNSSRMGMFSLFYGLPPGYWSSFSALQRPTVLVDELQARGYQLGLFSSATMYRPVVLDRTAFANVPDLRMVTEPESDPAWKRDRKLTGEWFEWLDARDPQRPFFGFLFYDATMGRNFPPDHPLQLEPESDETQAVEFAKYRTAVSFVDSVIGSVLEDLRSRGLLERTVVLISSDHGEEFGESGEQLEKHGSGYTRYQLVIPLVLAWPGRPVGVSYEHRTSHYDIVPTLMQDFFGCSNTAADYSVGRNLFDRTSWPWMIAGSYYNYAVLEPDQVTVTFPNGLYEVRDWDYHLLQQPQFRGSVLEAVSEQNARFFHD